VDASQIKLVAVDLDGTLLRTDKTISEYTIAVLKRCRESGIKIIYATGRDRVNTEMIPDGLFDGGVTANGAVAEVNGEVVYSALTPYQTARPFLMACDKRGLRIASQADSVDYSNFTVSDEWPWITNFKIVDFSKHDKDAEKIYTYDLTSEDIQFLKDQLPKELYMVIAMDGLAMIMHKDTTKSKAVAALAGHWGINQSEIAAFGDDLNDIDMLSHAGIGMAMQNALPEVKAVADYICGDCDEDGMARWIEDNILK